AYDQYEWVIRKRPRHAEALVRLGVLAEGDNRTTAAEAFFHQAAIADPHSVPAAAYRADMLFRLGRVEESAAESRRALRLAPAEPKANFWLGRALLVLDAQAHGAEA